MGLVLGAGNVAAIPALDALHTLFVAGHVCLLKMSPVNAYAGPLFERAFAPLVERGFLEFVYGGPDVGAYCTDHPSIGAVHVTGSSETHDRIVWGVEPERTERKQQNDPRLKKAITSELGNITPVIVPPGDYSEKELDHLARSVAGMVAHNASFNCIAAKMLVLPRGSRVRDELLSRLMRELEKVPLRRAYYPGAAERYAALTEGVSQLHKIGTPRDGESPVDAHPGTRTGAVRRAVPSRTLLQRLERGLARRARSTRVSGGGRSVREPHPLGIASGRPHSARIDRTRRLAPPRGRAGDNDSSTAW